MALGKFWCLTRMVYLPMAYLYGKKFVGPTTPTILALREEIYSAHYLTIDWAQARSSCAKEDLVCPRTRLQNAVWSWLYKWVEPVMSSWAMSKLRGRALDRLMAHPLRRREHAVPLHLLCQQGSKHGLLLGGRSQFRRIQAASCEST